MASKRIYDIPGHAHFVTFSCYKRRTYLDHAATRQMVLAALSRHLPRWAGRCLGFVVMPDHVHALLWFADPNALSRFMNVWKGSSSRYIKEYVRRQRVQYAECLDENDAVWQRRYYDFNVTTEAKAREKLIYMHNNPVRRGLADESCQWQHGSARWYEQGKSVGVPLTTWEELQ